MKREKQEGSIMTVGPVPEDLKTWVKLCANLSGRRAYEVVTEALTEHRKKHANKIMGQGNAYTQAIEDSK